MTAQATKGTRPRARVPISFAPGAGLAAAKVRGGVKCGGCDTRHPPLDCAACGAPMVIALAAGAHAMTFCRACARVLIAARAESRHERELIAARTRAAQAAHTAQAAQLALPFDTPNPDPLISTPRSTGSDGSDGSTHGRTTAPARKAGAA